MTRGPKHQYLIHRRTPPWRKMGPDAYRLPPHPLVLAWWFWSILLSHLHPYLPAALPKRNQWIGKRLPHRIGSDHRFPGRHSCCWEWGLSYLASVGAAAPHPDLIERPR